MRTTAFIQTIDDQRGVGVAESELASGLIDVVFVNGATATQITLSHDELDALESAMSLYWDAKFAALLAREDDEDEDEDEDEDDYGCDDDCPVCNGDYGDDDDDGI